MKKMLLNAMSRLRVHLSSPNFDFTVDLTIPAILVAYLLAEWISR